jgi:hypothetical protein
MLGVGPGDRVHHPRLPRRRHTVWERESGGQLCRVEPVNLVGGYGVSAQPSHHQEGPAVLRLAFFQAGNAARRQDPQLAGFYHRLMTQQGHCHTQPCVAVARKLVERTWTVLTPGHPLLAPRRRRPADQPPGGEAGDQGPPHCTGSCPGQCPGAQRSHKRRQADPLNRGDHTEPFLR